MIRRYVSTAKAADDFMYDLFNGKDLSGWTLTNCKVDVKDGVLKLVEGNGFIRTNQQYGDFILELDWKAPDQEKYDCGIFVRAEWPSAKKGREWPTQYQINLKNGEEGNLVGHPEATSKGLVKKGEWNHFKITAIGKKLSLDINGQHAWTFDKLENASGVIGIQSEVPTGGQFQFRSLHLMEPGFQNLFNGRDLTGWEGDTKGHAVENGAIVCIEDKGGNLYTKDEYDDYVFRFDFKIGPRGNNGLGIRMPLKGHPSHDGMELQIIDEQDPEYKTRLKPYQRHGSVYGVAPAKENDAQKPVGEWNSQEVVCDGPNIKVTLNGEVILDVNLDDYSKGQFIDKDRHPGVHRTTGRIGFLGHGTRVEFRNVRVKPLQSGSSTAAAVAP